jgi:hypothetical protein
MGNILSPSQRGFIEAFANAESLTLEHLTVGLASLDHDLATYLGAVEYPATTLELVSSSADALFINAVDANRIGFALDYATRQLVAVTGAAPAGATPASRGQAATAVRFAQILLSLAISRHQGGPDVLRKLIDHKGEATALHNAALLFIGSTTPSPTSDSVRLHCEVLLLLLTLYSTVLYHPALPDSTAAAALHSTSPLVRGHDALADLYLDQAVYHEDVALVRVVLGRLLSLVADWASFKIQTYVQYKPGFQPSFTNLFNMFGMANREQRVDVASILGSRAAQIVSVLLTYKKPSHRSAGRVNVALDALTSAAPARVTAASLMVPVLGENTPSPTIRDLLAGISQRIESTPELAAVLYQLLCHRNAETIELLSPARPDHSPAPVLQGLSEAQVADLFTGIAHVVYDCVASSGIAPMTFLASTVFLLVSTEAQFMLRLFAMETRAPWYTERFIGSISVGSLIVTVVARTVARAVALGNHDIAELNLGLLCNVAPSVNQLHMIAGQRLATMLKHMLKRVLKSREEVAADSSNYAAAATLQSIENHCCMTIDLMLGILDGSSRGNHSLLYDLLHQKAEIFGVTAQWPPGSALADAAAPLAKLVGYYEAELASCATDASVDEVMRIIKRVAEDVSAPDIVVGLGKRRGGGDDVDESGISTCEANVFEYVEDDDAYEYFAPLLWHAVIQRSGSVLVFPVVHSHASLRLLQENASGQ